MKRYCNKCSCDPAMWDPWGDFGERNFTCDTGLQTRK